MPETLPRQLTIPQKLALFREHTGLVFNIRPFEEVQNIALDDTEALVLVRTHEMKQTARGWKLLKRGRRIITFELRDFRWMQTGSITSWDEDFEPHEVAELRRVVTPHEYIERTRRERDAYRWGTAKTPMDSWLRQLDGYGQGTVLDWK